MKWYDVPEEEQQLAEDMAAAVMETFLPKSNAANAYELLEDVIRAIETEPLRYDQAVWFSSVNRNLGYLREDEKELPNCGTMACIAGWTAIMKHQTPPDVMDTAEVAAELLGFDWHYPTPSEPPDSDDYDRSNYWTDEAEATRAIRDLFDDNLHTVAEDGCLPMQGTVEYAQLGVTKIRKFMAEYGERLKAKVYNAN